MRTNTSSGNGWAQFPRPPHSRRQAGAARCTRPIPSPQEENTGVFTIMRLMGHSNGTSSKPSVHPLPESVECALRENVMLL